MCNVYYLYRTKFIVYVGRIHTSCSEAGAIKVWTAGQRVDPSTNSKFVWKPYPDINIDMAYTNWASAQPDFGGNIKSPAFIFVYFQTWNGMILDAMPEIIILGEDLILSTNNAHCVKSIWNNICLHVIFSIFRGSSPGVIVSSLPAIFCWSTILPT